MNLLINAISAKRGGAVTYLQNVLPELQLQLSRSGYNRIVVWRGQATTADEVWPAGIEYQQDIFASGGTGAIGGNLRRLYFDQIKLPRLMNSHRYDTLFSTANIGPLRCPGRHVLLVRNTAYFDATFMTRMKSIKVRVYYLLQRWLTMLCIAAADCVLFPSQTMLALVAKYKRTDRANWNVALYGTRHDLFYPAAHPHPFANNGKVRLLNVSLYSDQKNLGTLFQAVEHLHAQLPGRFKLRLTAGFQQDWLGESSFFPNFRYEKTRYNRLVAIEIAEDVNWRIYQTLPELYQNSDIFVFPSYTESFGHPLIEAMACGLPIVASDIPTNRELCGDAAIYFSTFDASSCANAIQQVAEDTCLRERLIEVGIQRAAHFTWDQHVTTLIHALKGTRR